MGFDPVDWIRPFNVPFVPEVLLLLLLLLALLLLELMFSGLFDVNNPSISMVQ